MKANSYLYNGKESIPDLNLNLYDYGARFYDPVIGRWSVSDPLAHEREWLSPYNFVQNNPINRVYPTGALDNPIYGTEGEFLGTDDKGLQGNAIVMNKDNFKQGMAYNEATAFDLSPNLGFMSSNTKSRMETHFVGLKDRPDYDGFVTINEGVQWAKDHPGALNNITADNKLYLDASKLNFGSMKSRDLIEGQTVSINVFHHTNFISNSSRYTSYALGNTQIKLLNRKTGEVKLFNNDNYDWDYHQAGYLHSNTSPPNSKRDRLVWGDRIPKRLNDTHGVRINIYGTATLNK